MRKWSEETGSPATRLVDGLGIGRSKYYQWRRRYGRVNEHNAWIPRDHWLEGWEKEAIIAIEAREFASSLELAFRIARAFATRVEDVFLYTLEPGEDPASPEARQPLVRLPGRLRNGRLHTGRRAPRRRRAAATGTQTFKAIRPPATQALMQGRDGSEQKVGGQTCRRCGVLHLCAAPDCGMLLFEGRAPLAPCGRHGS